MNIMTPKQQRVVLHLTQLHINTVEEIMVRWSSIYDDKVVIEGFTNDGKEFAMLINPMGDVEVMGL